MSSRGFRLTYALWSGILLLAACADAPTSPTDPAFDISDGAHLGNDHFFFLPPMVPEPSPGGAFNGSLSPEVQVCAWDGTECTVLLAAFSTDAGYGSETIRVSETDEHYVVNWHTEEILEQYPLSAGEVYRVRVFALGQELGFADFDVVSNGQELKNVDTDDSVPLKDGRTLPIKFRIEHGALVPGEIVSRGAAHTCAVAVDGKAYCWGRNTDGEIGTGTAGGNFSTPQLVAGGLTWQSVQASSRHTCGLTTGGQVYCWGRNSLGQLGLGFRDFVPHSTPEPVVGGHTFESLASFGAGTSLSSCAITPSGDMYCWGLNTFGELGTGTASFIEPSPQLVTGGHTFAGPAAMEARTTCGLSTAGEILCWGANNFGQLGRGTIAGGANPTPAPVSGGLSFIAVTVGGLTACGIDDAGNAHCWGRNEDGEMGIGAAGGPNPSPQLVTGGHAFVQLSGAFIVSCGLDTSGAALCWGRNHRGQLGRGFDSPFEPAPGLVVGGHTFRSLGTSCGVTTTGDVYCWGGNHEGQIGNGTITPFETVPHFAFDLDPGSP